MYKQTFQKRSFRFKRPRLTSSSLKWIGLGLLLFIIGLLIGITTRTPLWIGFAAYGTLSALIGSFTILLIQRFLPLKLKQTKQHWCRICGYTTDECRCH